MNKLIKKIDAQKIVVFLAAALAVAARNHNHSGSQSLEFSAQFI